MKLIGDKNKVAFEVGPVDKENLASLEVNLWIAGECASEAGNRAYLPSYVTSLGRDLERLENTDFMIPDMLGRDEVTIFDFLENELSGEYFELMNFDISVSAATVYGNEEKGVFRLIYKIHSPRTVPTVDLSVKIMEVDRSELIDILVALRSSLPSVWV